jgi:predicted O-methyltransferase YrrM
MEHSFELQQYLESHIEPREDFLVELERETHLTCIHPRMLSGHLQGKILNMLCRMIHPKRVLELGTYTAYSTISMALALNDKALIHTIELHDEQEGIIRKYLHKSGMNSRVICHFGDAIDLIPTIDEVFDLVFIDADKRQYSEYYQLVFDKVRSGGYLIADNTLWDGKVTNSELSDSQTQGIINFNRLVKNDSRVEQVILPFRDGMSLIRKK